MYDVIILGGGPAGYAAGIYTGRANLKTLVIEKLSPGGQMGTTDVVDNYPGFPDGVNGYDLAMKMKAQAERFGVSTELADVTAISLQGDVKTIDTSMGRQEAKALILATGATPRKLAVPGEAAFTGKGVSYCATCDGSFYRGKTVAVVGGGDTAAADALYLAKLAKKVYVIHRRDKLRASKAYLMPLKEHNNIEFIWNTTVSEIAGQDNVTDLTLRHNNGVLEPLPIDGVFIAVGNEPNSALFRGQLSLNDGGYVAAGENTKTNADGVFAIGDVRSKPLRQISTAVGDGATAAYMAEAYLNLHSTNK